MEIHPIQSWTAMKSMDLKEKQEEKKIETIKKLYWKITMIKGIY